VSYDAFANVTALPSADAGGHELKSSYYVDNQVASQEQQQAGKAKTISLSYDPAGRSRANGARQHHARRCIRA
jgi:hypothetical protein